MNGADLIRNMVDDLERSFEYISEEDEELREDLGRDIDRYWDYKDSIDALLEGLEVE